MKRRYKLFFALLLMTCLSIVVMHRSQKVASLAITSNQLTHKAIPVVARRRLSLTKGEGGPHAICEPYGARTSEIIGRATDSTGVEHVLWKYTRDIHGHTDGEGERFSIKVTTLLAESVCGASYYPGVDDAITDRIELDTARLLSLQLYQEFIKQAGGLEEFKAGFLETLRQRSLDPYDSVTFDSVDVWVWKQIGLDVPRDQYDRIENIDDNYKYDDNGPIGF